ncbi:hypothetical protein N9M50_02795 [Alphaproteobacteria bacterium]|nr:hypothetical protein [Alphaproteobacteria bacterium]
MHFRIIPILLISFLAACAQPSKFENMVVYSSSALVVPDNAKNSIAVKYVTGGDKTNPLWTSQVDAQTFKSALINSLANLGLLSRGGDEDITVSAHVHDLIQPLVGLSFSVTSIVSYTVETSSKRKVFNVTAIGTATMGDAFVGITRLRIANEKSIQNNIESFTVSLVDFLSQ